MTQHVPKEPTQQPASTAVPRRILPVIVLSQFAATSL
jgi:DHA1 family inner membrane transport protein